MAPALILVVALFLSLQAILPGISTRLLAQGNAAPAAPGPLLDYDVFKTKVQPILTAARTGNARCSACHSRGAGGYLEPLTPGGAYTEDQSRRNFDRVSRLVVPGESFTSILDGMREAPQVQLITNRHEGGACLMAEAYAKATRTPGVCVVTRGPGATHASIGIHCARHDSTPQIGRAHV